ncbi:hypothetical protein [Nocardia sp. SSK8]|uniref:hypothetical protein n=1 Tax=Nocardia sp. SSK8 TaxID=3120154 RepID=UPI00300B1BB9
MTAEFKVEPAALDAFGVILRNLATQSDQAKVYASGYLALSSEQARIYFSVKGYMDSLQAILTSNYEQMSALARQSSDEIFRSSGMYRTLDLERAKQLDQTYSTEPK